QYPGVNFELVNAAITAINSHVVLEVAKDCAQHQGDLFIVYLGNNEVVGPFGAGTVFTPLATNLATIRASLFLRSTRVGQVLEDLLHLASRDEKKPQAWRGMEMFLGNQIRASDQRMKNVYSHFQRNLTDLLKVANRAG